MGMSQISCHFPMAKDQDGVNEFYLKIVGNASLKFWLRGRREEYQELPTLQSQQGEYTQEVLINYPEKNP